MYVQTPPKRPSSAIKFSRIGRVRNPANLTNNNFYKKPTSNHQPLLPLAHAAEISAQLAKLSVPQSPRRTTFATTHKNSPDTSLMFILPHKNATQHASARKSERSSSQKQRQDSQNNNNSLRLSSSKQSAQKLLTQVTKPIPVESRPKQTSLVTGRTPPLQQKPFSNNTQVVITHYGRSLHQASQVRRVDQKRNTLSSFKQRETLGTTSYENSQAATWRKDPSFTSQSNDNYLCKYQLVKELGKGSYGTVHLAKRKQAEQVVAIKVYEKFKVNSDPSKFKNIRREISIMQNIDHPNIVKLLDNVETLTKINLVLQYCGSMSISQYVRAHHPLKKSQARMILKSTLLAIEYLHERNIVHRDLKAHNILINHHKAVKLIDFGFCTLSNQNIQTLFQLRLAAKNRKLSSIVGTPNYMAPQVLRRQDYIGEPVDMWSFGVLVYFVFENNYPFKAENIKELARIVARGKFNFKQIKDPSIRSIVNRCLKLTPSERPTASRLLQDLWWTDTTQQTESNEQPNPEPVNLNIIEAKQQEKKPAQIA